MAVSAVRLASFNLLSGRSPAEGIAEPERLASAVAALDADVVALQEVDRHQDRSGAVDQAALAADALGAVDHRFVGLVHGTPGEAGWLAAPRPPGGRRGGRSAAPDPPPDGPTYGVALLLRMPVESWHVLHLDPPRGRYPVPIPAPRLRLLWIPDEPRAVVAAVLRSPRMTVACTHLSFVPGVNVFQLRRARRWLAELPGPRVLLGDLNLPGGLPARLTGWTPLVSGPTFPAPAPRVQLDHLLADGLPAGWHARGEVLELPVSDHRAVLAELTLP
jgi:endonuclease/exonuclease/phosphatase family metal-dependent hydrolase